MHQKIPIYADYILASTNSSIYVGATQDLERRIFEHKTKHFADSHTTKHGIDRLVWWQQCETWMDAHALELKLKNLQRAKKVEMVNQTNAKRQDLSYGHFHWSSSRIKRSVN